MSSRNLRVLIADRSPHFQETLRRVVADYLGCVVVGKAGSLNEAVRVARLSDPDVALLDVDLVIGQQPANLRRLADSFPNLRVLVMLNEESLDYRRAVAERWGYACIVKDDAENELTRVISAVSSVAV
jgi:DNA-binding NarL/FixJ family response regulator